MNSPTPPEPPGEAFEGGTTVDAFLSGAFHLVQPKGRGFRAGHDALLVAAAVSPAATGRALDMGSGAGAVAFAAAARAPGLAVVMAERNPAMAGLAERALRLPQNAALADRLSATCLDLLSTRPAREAAGLGEGAFDLVLTNPPFHPHGQRGSPDALREEARAVPDPDFLLRWIAVAASLLREGGHLLMIARPEVLPQILPAAQNRLGALSVLPLHPEGGGPASRILVSAVRGSRRPLRLLPSTVLDASLRAEVSAGRHHFAALTQP